jgi:hypothetical protein
LYAGGISGHEIRILTFACEPPHGRLPSSLDGQGNFLSNVYTVDLNSGHPTLIGAVQNQAELTGLVIAEPDP